MLATAQRLRPYAAITDNQVLLRETKFSESSIQRKKDSTLINIARQIAHRADEYKTLAAGYKIKPTDIVALNEAIADFEPLPTQASLIGSDRALATANLANQFKEATRLLKLLDDLVPALVEDQTFVDRYKTVRKVADRSSHGSAPSLKTSSPDSK